MATNSTQITTGNLSTSSVAADLNLNAKNWTSHDELIMNIYKYRLIFLLVVYSFITIILIGVCVMIYVNYNLRTPTPVYSDVYNSGRRRTISYSQSESNRISSARIIEEDES
jgi:hypothetical protein